MAKENNIHQHHSGSGDNIAGDKVVHNNQHYIYAKHSKVSSEKLKNTLITYYKQNFKTISLLIEEDKKLIEDIYVNLAIIKEEKEEETKDKSKFLDRDKIISSYEKIYKPKEPIAIEELIEKSSKFNSAKALIYGKAGIGKTTFCKYIAYRWAKGELYGEFENIIYIALREWKDDGLESIIKKIYFEEKHQKEAIEIDQSKTLFLFDGYDELSDTSLLHSVIKKYNLQNYIITSRPYGYRKSDFDVNEVFETIGFTDENVTAYIDKFFEEQSHKANLQNFLKQNINIKHIAYIPLMLEMICSLWKEKAKSNQSFLSPMTMTELYTEVIDNLLSNYARKKGYEEVYKKKYKKQIIIYLGSVAFESLKNQKIVIDGKVLENSLDNITTDDEDDFLEKNIFYTGLLKSDNKYQDPWKNSYEFPHLTFQEYFSALYVSKLPKEEISEVILDYKFYPYMQVFFAFLGGLIEDKEWLIHEIESEYRDLIGLYEIFLILNILAQVQKNEINSELISGLNSNLIKYLRNDLLNKKYYIDLLIKLEDMINHINEELSKFLLEEVRNSKNRYQIKILSNVLVPIKNKYREVKLYYRKQIVKNIGKHYFKLKTMPMQDKTTQSVLRDKSLNDNFFKPQSFYLNLEKIISDEEIVSLFKKETGNGIFLEKIVKPLAKLAKKNKKVTPFLKKSLKNINNNPYLLHQISKCLALISKDDISIIDYLLKIIKNDVIENEIKEHAIKSLILTEQYNKDILKTYVDFLNENSDSSIDIVGFITSLKVIEYYFINELIKIISNESIDIGIREWLATYLAELTFLKNNILDEINIGILDNKIKMKLILHSSVTAISKIFKDKAKIIIINCFYKNLPLYLKNNRLYTIENGEEIQIQIEVSLEEIESTKRELGLPFS